MYICIYICIHTCMYTYVHIYTYIYIHMYTHPPLCRELSPSLDDRAHKSFQQTIKLQNNTLMFAPPPRYVLKVLVSF